MSIKPGGATPRMRQALLVPVALSGQGLQGAEEVWRVYR